MQQAVKVFLRCSRIRYSWKLESAVKVGRAVCRQAGSTTAASFSLICSSTSDGYLVARRVIGRLVRLTAIDSEAFL